MEWGWPQWIVAILYALSLSVNVALHGKKREGNHNGFLSIVLVAIMAALLRAGGFW